jgi:hypothetical protein
VAAKGVVLWFNHLMLQQKGTQTSDNAYLMSIKQQTRAVMKQKTQVLFVQF